MARQADPGGAGVKVVITGGTGSLGAALAARWLALGADRVVIFSRDEQKQAQLAERLGEHRALRWFLGDVRDLARCEAAFYGCDTVIHCAALKRVDAVAYNPSEVRQTNINGSANVIAAAVAAGVQRVLMISSDKAVAPTNLYGVSKAQMEFEAIASNALTVPRGMRIAVARYGNVLGSRGSVLWRWRAQSEAGMPLTLTDERMTRFWITLPQAVAFVLVCVARMRGGDLFVPKLPAGRVADLAEAFAPGWPVEYVGLRAGGEKLTEVLLNADELTRTLDIGDSYLVRPAFQSWASTTPWPGTPVPSAFEYRSDTAPAVDPAVLASWIKEALA